MNILTNEIWNYIEYIGTGFGLLFILFAVFEKNVSWVFGFLSSLCFFALYLKVPLVFNSILMVYYMIVAVYGFYSWSNAKSRVKTQQIKVIKLHKFYDVAIIIIGLVISGVFYNFLDNTSFILHVLDSVTAGFSVIATLMQVRKILNNWIYWVVIDIVSAVMLVLSELYWGAALMIVYAIGALYGYYSWGKIIVKDKKAHEIVGHDADLA